MARLANIVPKSSKSFDPLRHLICGDVVVTSLGLLIIYPQFGERLLYIPLLRIVDSPCPISAYLRINRLFPARRSSPVLLILGPKGLFPLTKRKFVSPFRSHLVAAGISNAQSFRSQSVSMRSGLVGL